MEWARALESREKLELFPTKLDEIVPAEHSFRLVDAILRKVDWTSWEAKYKQRTAATERPFATIEQLVGVRSFLTR